MEFTLNLSSKVDDSAAGGNWNSQNTSVSKTLAIDEIQCASKRMLETIDEEDVRKFLRFNTQLSGVTLANAHKMKEVRNAVPLELDIGLENILESILGKKPKEDQTIKSAQIWMFACLVIFDILNPQEAGRQKAANLTLQERMKKIMPWIKATGFGPESAIMRELAQISRGRQAVTRLGTCVNTLLKVCESNGADKMTEPHNFASAFPLISLKFCGSSTASTLSGEEEAFNPDDAPEKINRARMALAVEMTSILRSVKNMTVNLCNAGMQQNEYPDAFTEPVKGLLRMVFLPNNMLEDYTPVMYKKEPEPDKLTAKRGPETVNAMMFYQLKSEITKYEEKMNTYYKEAFEASTAAVEGLALSGIDSIFNFPAPAEPPAKRSKAK